MMPGGIGQVTIKGTDTMVILGQRWAETYMRLQPNATDPGDRWRIRHRHRRPDQRRRRTSAKRPVP